MTYEEFKQDFLPQFLNIRSFAGKMRLADQNLQRIGSGTGRVVYDIDGEKVLKLAKNPKGIAQNEVEARLGQDYMAEEVVTEVFESADNDTWLIAEKGKKVTDKRIREVTGIPTLADLYIYLRNFESENNGRGKFRSQDKDVEEFLKENEFAQDLQNFIGNFSQSPGDMGRPSTYGEVLRDGQPTIVLTDYGLNDEVYDTHYGPDRKEQRYQMYELFNYADGNDDILSDTGDQGDIKRGMWAMVPYSVDDGPGVYNEEFNNFISNRDEYPDDSITGLPLLTDLFHECKNNIKEVLSRVENKEHFYKNLLKLQEFLIRRGFYTNERLGMLSEDYPREKADRVANRITTKLGIQEPKFLGQGTIGVAYDIGDNKVLKITKDNSEAYENLKLVGQKLKYIADIYRVFEVTPENQPKGEWKTYAIILEKLQSDEATFKQMYDRLDYVFKNIFNTDYKEAVNSYLDGYSYSDEGIDKTQIDAYFKKNPKDGEFFFSILRIVEELREHGIDSYDFYNPENLGYKPSGVIGFFDVGFTDFFAQPHGAEQMNVSVSEDGSAKFSTDNSVGQDSFPVYNTNDTSPSINNNLDANVASTMYEDLEYNHVKGDATDDEYMLTENIESLKQQLAQAAQKIYDDWEQNEEGECDMYGVGGICHDIADAMCDVLTNNGFECTTVSQQSGEQHVYSLARNDKAIYIVDIPPQLYERGGGYCWNKIPNVKFNEDYVVVDYQSDDPHDEEYDGYFTGEFLEEERNKEYMSGSKTVKVKRKCQLGGKADGTSEPCNQGDINNLEFGSINEKHLQVIEYFSSLVPSIEQNSMKTLNETDIMALHDLPFKDEVEQLGGKIYSVGGAVRDEFLGKESKDLDILITGIPMERLAGILSAHGRVDAVGQSFGILKFKPEGASEEIDVAIPRTEVATGAGGHKGFDVSSDHELPLEKDLERRDFTINAIAKDIDGNIIDPYGGQKDLQNKIIRVVNPEAFSDDPLRMLRAVQFASRFGFNIEPKTAKMIAQNASRIKEIPPERILTEFDKIVKKGNKLTGAFLLKELALTPQIFGKDAGMYLGNEWNDVQTMGEFIWLLGHHLVPDIAEFYKNNLKGDLDTYKEIKALNFAFQADENADPVTARSVAHNMFRTSPQAFNSQIIPDAIKRAGQELNSGQYPKTFTELAVNGNDLMNNGLKGKEIGETLKSLLIKVYGDSVKNDREELLSLVKQSNGAVEENYGSYNRNMPDTWNVNGEMVDILFFVKKYDNWNNRTANNKGYHNDPTRDSIQEFLQNNYEDFSRDEKLKKLLYWELIDRELLNEEDVKKVSYTGAVLDDDSRQSLIKVFHTMIPEGWEIVAHHMTINMGEIDEMYESLLGDDVKLTVTSYAMDDKVMAVGVKGCPTINQIPHITVAVNRKGGGKPYLSNKLRDWKPINFPIELTGKIEEVA